MFYNLNLDAKDLGPPHFQMLVSMVSNGMPSVEMMLQQILAYPVTAYRVDQTMKFRLIQPPT